MYYSETVEPRLVDYTAKGNLGYEAMLHITETVGTHHSLSVNDSLKHGHIAWMMVDLRVEVKRRPKTDEKLCIRTWSRGKAEAGSTYREYDVKSESGEQLFMESAKFALVDTRIMKMTKLSDELIEAYKPEDETQFDGDAPKMHAPDTWECEMPLIMRKTDIDFNGHVHNTKYLDYALEGQQFEISQGLLPCHPAPKQRKEGVEEKEEHERRKDRRGEGKTRTGEGSCRSDACRTRSSSGRVSWGRAGRPTRS